MNTFNEKLKELRKNTGKTQKQVATEMGLLTTTYSNYEQGIREPSLENLKIICDYYGVSADYLISND